MYEDVEFKSEGSTLRGRYYKANGTRNATVVMTHGTSATITMSIDRYAEAICKAGFDILLYDHKNFGISDGEPRQQINPWLQARGYRDAVTFLRETRRPEHVALWGDSYTGGLVMVAAALIENISAVVAQIPVCGATWPDGQIDGAAFTRLRDLFETGDVSGSPQETVGPLPVVSPDQLNAPSLLVPPQAFRWFVEYGGRFGSGWENCATRTVPKTDVPCSPFVTAPHLNMPVQMMIGENDEMIHCNREIQEAVYERLAGPKEKIVVPGGHFGLLWEDSAEFTFAANAQIDFLKRAIGK